MKVPFLFWNINHRALEKEVALLAAEHDAKVIILAESSIDPDLLIDQLSSAGVTHFSYPYSPAGTSGDIQVFLRMTDCELQPVYDDPNNHVTIRRLVFPNLPDLLLVVVHLQSKLHFDGDDQAQLAYRLATKIGESEIEFKHRRTILVGDLNMKPFEKGIVGSEGLHAVMTRQIAAVKSRVVDAHTRHYFYNPMWRFFGEHDEGPPGTYYYAASSKPISFFWNMFDQVMVRPDLMSSLEGVRILDSVGNHSLLDVYRIPDSNFGSDHLPIYFRLQLE